MEDFKDEIINLIGVNYKKIRELGMNEDFIESCGIDSLNLITLVVELEKKFGIMVIDEQFSIDKISTVSKLNQYINEKKT